jgi:hypothetical protein
MAYVRNRETCEPKSVPADSNNFLSAARSPAASDPSRCRRRGDGVGARRGTLQLPIDDPLFWEESE